jgi:hypothetical protein
MRLSLFFLLIYSGSYAQINLYENIKSKISATHMLTDTSTTVNDVSFPLPITAKLMTDKFYRFVSLDYTVDAGSVEILMNQAIKLPVKFSEKTYSNLNCSSDKRGWMETVTLKHSSTNSARITNSFVSNDARTVGFNLKINIPIPGLGGSVEGSTSKSETVSFGTSQTNETQWSNSDEETTTRAINFDVSPYMMLYVQFRMAEYTLRVPFKAKLTVKGYVNLEYVSKFRWSPGYNIPGTERVLGRDKIEIATILPSEAERTFEIKGFLEGSKSVVLDVTYAEKKYNEARCPSSIPPEKPTLDSSYVNSFLTQIHVSDFNATKKIMKSLRNEKRTVLDSAGKQVDSSISKLQGLQFHRALFNKGVISNIRPNYWQAVCETVNLPLCSHTGSWYGPERQSKEEAQQDADAHKAKCTSHDPGVINW